MSQNFHSGRQRLRQLDGMTPGMWKEKEVVRDEVWEALTALIGTTKVISLGSTVLESRKQATNKKLAGHATAALAKRAAEPIAIRFGRQEGGGKSINQELTFQPGSSIRCFAFLAFQAGMIQHTRRPTTCRHQRRILCLLGDDAVAANHQCHCP